MLTLDHIVVHVDNSNEISALKSELDKASIPFEPDWGKAAKGFKIANIWIGQQYFEIVDILSADNLWQPQWSERHAQGDRGIYCIFLKTNEPIEQLHAKFLSEGIKATEPERTRFKWMFGLLEKKLPWQFMLLPNIPGTPIELGIIRYDEGAEKKHKPFMVPNTEDIGIVGLSRAVVYSEHCDEAKTYLERIGRIVSEDIPIELNEKGSSEQRIIELKAELKADLSFSGFQVANVAVVP